MHFIHNKINEKLEKPQMSLDDFYVEYYNLYEAKQINEKNISKWREKTIFIFFLFFLLIIIYFLYKQKFSSTLVLP
jgi:dipeptide/tripeptide permease